MLLMLMHAVFYPVDLLLKGSNCISSVTTTKSGPSESGSASEVRKMQKPADFHSFIVIVFVLTSDLSLSAQGSFRHDLYPRPGLMDHRLWRGHAGVMERYYMVNIHDKSPVRRTLIPVNKQKTHPDRGRTFFFLRNC